MRLETHVEGCCITVLEVWYLISEGWTFKESCTNDNIWPACIHIIVRSSYTECDKTCRKTVWINWLMN